MTVSTTESPHRLARAPFGLQHETKRSIVRRLFSDIAERYDWFNRLSSLGMDQSWRKAALRRAELEAGHKVLDVCTGTGDLALLASRSGAEVIGADMTGPMLAVAKAKGASDPRVQWVQADAQALPFRGSLFDRVTIGFSTRNLSDLSTGLQDMVRVLRPGGSLVILETGRPSNPIVRAGYQAYLFTVARAIGFLLTGSCWPFTYLARSVKGFLSPDQMVQRLQASGTRAVHTPLAGGLASLFIATKDAS